MAGATEVIHQIDRSRLSMETCKNDHSDSLQLLRGDYVKRGLGLDRGA